VVCKRAQRDTTFMRTTPPAATNRLADTEVSDRPSTGAGTFEEVVLPHLDAAYRLARWLTGRSHEAEDLVQEASLRAFRYLHTFTGGNGRAWFLKIVRNTCYQWRGRAAAAVTDVFDERLHSAAQPTGDPEVLFARAEGSALIERALNELPLRFRELLVLRELEGLSYRELADIGGVPVGTVMSRLSRARQALHQVLTGLEQKGRAKRRCA
jgi:RNA polymerase sigma-70 factor, ECF subfamily